MAISPISGLPQTSGAGGAGAAAGLADNFETFLTLLTEQMKNQDPLSPMDSTQFVNQLVQFSSVEQQINQNNNLETLIGLQLAAGQAAAGAYLGREVTANSAQAELAGGQARWSYALPQNADQAKLIVENSAGKIVYAGDAEKAGGSHEFVWNGKDNLGAPLPPGVYKLSVAALDSAGEKISANVQIRGRVTAADFADGEPMLQIGKVRVSMADVLSLYESAPDGA